MLAAIAAVSTNGVIGKNQQLPWHLKADLQHFKKLTLGHPVIMGRLTHEAIGRALPGRENIIITRDLNYSAQGCRIFNSLEKALAYVAQAPLAFIIGGEKIYKAALPYLQRLYLTEIHTTIEGDAYFPEFSKENWRAVYREKHLRDEDNEYDYSFVEWQRI